jgi:hypothetical protein
MDEDKGEEADAGDEEGAEKEIFHIHNRIRISRPLFFVRPDSYLKHCPKHIKRLPVMKAATCSRACPGKKGGCKFAQMEKEEDLTQPPPS